MCKAAVELVASRDRMKLELRGDVLICEGRSWARRTAIYVPVECFSVDRSQRRDGRTLIKGLAAPALVVVIAVLALGGFYLAAYLEAPVDLHAAAAAIREVMLAGLAPAFLYTAVALGRFPRLIDTVRVDIHTEDAQARLEFWHTPGADPAVDRLVRRLFEVHVAESRDAAYPLKTGYAWQHRRPIRALVAGAVGGMAALYVLAIIVRLGMHWYTGAPVTVAPAFFAIFLLPWLWEGGKYLLGQALLAREPAAFRRGLKYYHREEFERARDGFLETVADHPEHVPSLFFLTQHYAQRFDFERAFQYCNRLFPLAPEIAESMQEDIWSLKRLAGRMAGDPSTR